MVVVTRGSTQPGTDERVVQQIGNRLHGPSPRAEVLPPVNIVYSPSSMRCGRG